MLLTSHTLRHAPSTPQHFMWKCPTRSHFHPARVSQCASLFTPLRARELITKCQMILGESGPCCAHCLHRGCLLGLRGPLPCGNIHLDVCHKELLRVTQKCRGAQTPLGSASGRRHSPRDREADGWQMGTYKFNHSGKVTRALDKWVSWDVLRKQCYYFHFCP